MKKKELEEVTEEKREPKVYGYVRVSTKKQDLTRQVMAIYEYAEKNNLKVDKIFEDKETGLNFNRKGYNELVDRTITEDDIIIVHSIDRLGRNKKELETEIKHITETRKTTLIVITAPFLTKGLNVKTTDPMSKLMYELTRNLFFEFLTTIAQFEIEQKKERVKTGIDNMEIKNGKKWSRKTGNYTGRPNIFEKIDKKKLIEYIKKGYKNKEIIELMKLKESTFYKIKNILKQENLI